MNGQGDIAMARTLSYRVGLKKQAAAGRSVVRIVAAARKAAGQDLWSKQVAVIEGTGIPREEEAALLAAIGYRAVEFSIAWPDMMGPDGTPNAEGIARCKRWINALRQHGMTPIISFNRWERPLWVRLKKDWVNVKSAAAFSRYTALLHEQFGMDAVIRTMQGEAWTQSAKELRQWRSIDSVKRGPAAGLHKNGDWAHVQASGEYAYQS